ncbi:MAG: RNA-processing protein [Candidatus Aenigmarchaeota archaeon ex4484_224]|nr:MAG: RNA-processing protein [Candidatus Aenigmarchaeota archaeon ex4484_224]
MYKDVVKISEEKAKYLKKNKELVKKLEDLANVKILIKENLVEIESENSLNILKAKSVITAINRGFEFEKALYLLDDEYRLEIIDITQYSGKSKNRLTELRGRVIGKNGRIKKLIEEMTETFLAIHGKTVSIIGRWDKIFVARRAVELVLSGAMFETLYRFLEKNKV